MHRRCTNGTLDNTLILTLFLALSLTLNLILPLMLTLIVTLTLGGGNSDQGITSAGAAAVAAGRQRVVLVLVVGRRHLGGAAAGRPRPQRHPQVLDRHNPDRVRADRVGDPAEKALSRGERHRECGTGPQAAADQVMRCADAQVSASSQ